MTSVRNVKEATSHEQGFEFILVPNPPSNMKPPSHQEFFLALAGFFSDEEIQAKLDGK